ncbi:MAG: hypothetical protein SAL07_23665 [Oscillatoria sp. PMC 1051.18]|nr:hypothetical protein [Oscillatoria sp. PMC 1050.18]MEC5032911.1 hypothetical protein [Oscillatoria sp. PMC 1051.18]
MATKPTRTKQTRVVLRDEVLEMGEELREVTKSSTLTELVSIMFSRYGEHLKQTWKVTAGDEAVSFPNQQGGKLAKLSPGAIST